MSLISKRNLPVNTRKIVILAMSLVMAAGAASAASADTTWDKTHPRRDQVNDRLHHQNVRIHQERREGEISAAKAHRLHLADRRIRAQERRDAAMHGSHLTRAEQHRLNKEENGVSQHIGA